jgi:hypothetical protein
LLGWMARNKKEKPRSGSFSMVLKHTSPRVHERERVLPNYKQRSFCLFWSIPPPGFIRLGVYSLIPWKSFTLGAGLNPHPGINPHPEKFTPSRGIDI